MDFSKLLSGAQLQCPKCKTLDLGPISICEGVSTENTKNIGRQYRKCSGNKLSSSERQCSGWWWLDNFQDRSPTSTSSSVQAPPPATLLVPCPGRRCIDLRNRRKRDRKADPACSRGLCTFCCKDEFFADPTKKVCQAPNHAKSQSSYSGQSTPQKNGNGRGGGGPSSINNGEAEFCSEPEIQILEPPSQDPSIALAVTPITSPASTQISSSMGSIASPTDTPSRPTSYAKMICPTFGAKLLGHIEPTLSPVAVQKLKSVGKKEQSTRISLHWWLNDDPSAVLRLEVSEPGFPWFHPKNCKDLVDVIGASEFRDSNLYSFWDGTSWIITSLNQPVQAGQLLILRSRTVTGNFDPSSAVRSGSQLRKRPCDAIENGETRQLKKHTSSAHSDIMVIEDIGSNPFLDNDNDVELVSIIPGSSKSSAASLGSSPSPSSQMATPTPSRRAKSGFPLKYVCDMHDGFTKMSEFPSHLSRQKKFETAFFNAEYKAATVSENYSAWRVVPQEILDKAVALGQTSDALWEKFIKPYRKLRLNDMEILRGN